MANDFTNVLPKILAQAIQVLRGALVMPQLVATEYGVEASKKGSVIDVPIDPVINVRNVVPDPNQPADTSVAPGTVQIPLDQWKEAPFQMTDKELLQVMEGTVPMCVRSAVDALASTVNAYLFGLYIDVYGYAGTAGTTPFSGSPGTTAAATQARKILNQQLAPYTMRRLVLDPEAGAAALDLGAFRDVSASADPQVITEGIIGRKYGFDSYEDQQVPTHTAGTITTGLVAKASTAQAVGLKAIVCTTAATTGACALLEGDIVTFAGDDQTYVLTADATEASAATDVTLNIEPGLKVALAGSEAVTVKATHVVNLAFQRNAFAFASRPLQDVATQVGVQVASESVTDPMTGLSMRLEVTRQYKQTLWAFDMLYGGKCIDPRKATRLAG